MVGVFEYGMNTTMYSFDPGFQIDESYIPLHRGFQWVMRFLVGVCIMLILIFILRVYIYWPTLILRHKNNASISFLFFLFTIGFLYKDDPHGFAASGRAFIFQAIMTNMYVIILQRLYTLSNAGRKDILEAKALSQSKDGKAKEKQYEVVNTSIDPDDDFDNELKPEN